MCEYALSIAINSYLNFQFPAGNPKLGSVPFRKIPLAFIEKRYLIYVALLEKEFFKIFTYCKRHSPVIVPRKQFVYQESNCRCKVRSHSVY